MSSDEKIKKLEELSEQAALGGGEARIERQHNAGRLTIRQIGGQVSSSPGLKTFGILCDDVDGTGDCLVPILAGHGPFHHFDPLHTVQGDGPPIHRGHIGPVDRPAVNKNQGAGKTVLPESPHGHILFARRGFPDGDIRQGSKGIEYRIPSFDDILRYDTDEGRSCPGIFFHPGCGNDDFHFFGKNSGQNDQQ